MLKYLMSTHCSNKWKETTLVSMPERWRVDGCWRLFMAWQKPTMVQPTLWAGKGHRYSVASCTQIDSVCVCVVLCLMWVSRHQIAIREIHFGPLPTSLWEYTTTMTSSLDDVMPDKWGRWAPLLWQPPAAMGVHPESSRHRGNRVPPGDGLPLPTRLSRSDCWELNWQQINHCRSPENKWKLSVLHYSTLIFARLYLFQDVKKKKIIKEQYVSITSHLLVWVYEYGLWMVTWPHVISEA